MPPGKMKNRGAFSAGPLLRHSGTARCCGLTAHIPIAPPGHPHFPLPPQHPPSSHPPLPSSSQSRSSQPSSSSPSSSRKIGQGSSVIQLPRGIAPCIAIKVTIIFLQQAAILIVCANQLAGRCADIKTPSFPCHHTPDMAALIFTLRYVCQDDIPVLEPEHTLSLGGSFLMMTPHLLVLPRKRLPRPMAFA